MLSAALGQRILRALRRDQDRGCLALQRRHPMQIDGACHVMRQSWGAGGGAVATSGPEAYILNGPEYNNAMVSAVTCCS